MVCNRPLLLLYCSTPELIENYDEAIRDETEIWDCHHRREVFNNGNTLSVKFLKKCGLYYHVQPEDLIFLKHSDHMKLHKRVEKYTRLGRPHSVETKEKMRKAALGHKVSESCREKIRQFHLGKKLSPETRAKLSLAHRRNQHEHN